MRDEKGNRLEQIHLKSERIKLSYTLNELSATHLKRGDNSKVRDEKGNRLEQIYLKTERIKLSYKLNELSATRLKRGRREREPLRAKILS